MSIVPCPSRLGNVWPSAVALRPRRWLPSRRLTRAATAATSGGGHPNPPTGVGTLPASRGRLVGDARASSPHAFSHQPASCQRCPHPIVHTHVGVLAAAAVKPSPGVSGPTPHDKITKRNVPGPSQPPTPWPTREPCSRRRLAHVRPPPKTHSLALSLRSAASFSATFSACVSSRPLASRSLRSE